MKGLKGLTDTGEDSKLVHRRIWSKMWFTRYLLLIKKKFNNPKDEYDSAPGRKYTAHFESFSPVSVNFLFLIKNIFQSRPGIVVKSVESEQNPLNSASYCLSGPQCLPC